MSAASSLNEIRTAPRALYPVPYLHQPAPPQRETEEILHETAMVVGEFPVNSFTENAFVRPIMITLCGHSFEEQDLRGWYAKKAECPVCRIPFDIERDTQRNYQLEEASLVARRTENLITRALGSFAMMTRQITESMSALELEARTAREETRVAVQRMSAMSDRLDSMENAYAARCRQSEADVKKYKKWWIQESNKSERLEKQIDAVKGIGKKDSARVLVSHFVPFLSPADEVERVMEES